MIAATVIADSISPAGVRLTTFELEYPRFIHAELMTHRMFSRNAASSRAIPVNRAIELIRENTARPIHWGKNQPGMTAKEECSAMLGGDAEFDGYSREEWWDEARDMAIVHAAEFARGGYHKQIVNRVLEPFSHIKVVCTATEYENFFWLRNHPDAQPEIQELARVMLAARDASTPVELEQGDWHVPYYESGVWVAEGRHALSTDPHIDIEGTPLADAIAISASCCAQVSYRKADTSLEKAQDIYKRLVDSEPVHASPFEHQATPMYVAEFKHVDVAVNDFLDSRSTLDSKGTTHVDRQGNAWSANFRGWIQNRQLIPNNVKRG